MQRASEIKQEKRRETLIEHADRARLSKKLVTLDDHVKLDVPIDDLAVHDPDYKHLIGFLKAMEFSTLTRRVAEYASIDAAQIEPDGSAASPTGLCAGSPSTPAGRPVPRKASSCRCPPPRTSPKGEGSSAEQAARPKRE